MRDGKDGQDLRGSETVLLVDDNADAREGMKRTLEWHGYEVLSADSPPQATEIIGEAPERIDLLVTDVVMPDGTGDAVARVLLDANPAARVLFVSGYTDREVRVDGIPEASSAFLGKPMTIQELASTVRDLLDRKDAE